MTEFGPTAANYRWSQGAIQAARQETAEPLAVIYPEDITPLFPHETDEYLNDLPRLETHRIADEMAKAPATVATRLADVREGVRLIETWRRRIAFDASVLADFATNHPQEFAQLPVEQQAQVQDIAARVE